MNTFWENRVAWTIGMFGAAWSLRVMGIHFTTFNEVKIPLGGPFEVFSIGCLLWLHGKYRKSLRER